MIEDKQLRARIALELAGNDCYMTILKQLEDLRPKPPYWEPKDNNVEEIKEKLAQQKWHDRILNLLDPRR